MNRRLIWIGLFALFLLACAGPARMGPGVSVGRDMAPPRDYVILINYELGMHCTGFDFTYCCILPPYNSILAQVVKTERKGDKPVLLGSDPDDPEVLVDGDKRFRLAYTHRDPDGIPNTYSYSKKLAYWGVPYRGRELPDSEFSSLYFYKDLKGSNPEHTSANAKKRRIGIDTPIKINQGPTGQNVGKGFLRYSGATGTVVFADSPVMENVPITLTGPGIWEALGLPLTPFNDRFTALTTLDETMFQPYQQSVVTLVDAKTRAPVIDSSGQVVRFFGVNPIDVPNCTHCHSNERANGTKYLKYKEEHDFWREMRGTSEYYAEIKAAAVSILEIHDDLHGTNFLAKWPASSSVYLRFGRDTIVCQGCHADNIVGRLSSRKAGNMRKADIRPDSPRLPDPEHLISPLTEAVHRSHERHVPMPDSLGFAGNCQLCHPAHRSDRTMDEFPITRDGKNYFAAGDVRDAKGCYTQRDVHGNPHRGKDVSGIPGYLNAVGTALVSEVATVKGKDKGLYCTNCHNMLSRELYKADHLTDAVQQTGRTLRNRPLKQIAAALGVSVDELMRDYLNPKVPMRGEDATSGVYRTWDRSGQTLAAIGRIEVDKQGKPVLTPPDVDGDRSVILVDEDPDGAKGVPASYAAATHGKDYWLAAGEPHCADCHRPPFVESMGGGAFPIDQPGKYALMRHSRGHAGITCQGCHESTHGLYPVNPAVDISSYRQAAQLNPDGSHGPVKCGACHRVNKYGVPSRHPKMIGEKGDVWAHYDKAVVLQHELR